MGDSNMAAMNLFRLNSRSICSALRQSQYMTKPIASTQITKVLSAQQVREKWGRGNWLCVPKGTHRFSDPTTWEGKHMMAPSTHWKVERYLATALIFLVPASFITYHPVLDYCLAAGLVLHAHWGLDTVALDYLHRKIIPSKVCEGMILLATIIAFAGLINFNYNDVGCVGAVREIWSLTK